MTASLTKDQIKEVLKTIIDPSQQKDLVALGFVSAIHIKDSNVSIILEVPAHKGPALEPLRKKAESSVLAMDGVTSATVIMTAHESQGRQEPENGATRRDAGSSNPPREKVLESKVKRFVAVASGKGGVGKSTTAVNLAVAMKLEGLRVGLLDADVYGPSQPRMLGVSGKPPAVGGEMVAPLENYGIKLMSMGLLVPDDTAMIWRGPMVQSALTQMLNAVAWGELDVIVIDLPPGTGDIQISLAQQVNLAGAVIVSTPQDLALIDARKGLNMFRKVNVPLLGIIENMSHFLCTDCGARHDIFGHGGAAAEAEKLGVPFLGEVPLEMAIRTTSDDGTPIVASQPDSQHAAHYQQIASALLDHLDTAQPKAAPKIVTE